MPFVAVRRRYAPAFSNRVAQLMHENIPFSIFDDQISRDGNAISLAYSAKTLYLVICMSNTEYYLVEELL